MKVSTGLLIIGFAIINLALILAGFSQLSRLRRRFEAAFKDLDSDQDLVATMGAYFDKLDMAAKKLDHLQKSYDHLSAIGARSIQKAGIVRFNPFRDTGGDQSFVLALLDNNDSGFLLTSIHGREGTRVYIKAVEYGASKYPLSDEEKDALAAASGKIKPATKPVPKNR